MDPAVAVTKQATGAAPVASSPGSRDAVVASKRTVVAGPGTVADVRPGFEGTWNSATATPLERPPALKDKAFFTPQEARAMQLEIERFKRTGLVRNVSTAGDGKTTSTAALGASLEVPTPDGPISLKVPAGSQHGKLLKIKGRGAPKLKGGGKGDLLARLKLTVPEKVSKKERELLEELRKVRR